MMRKLFLSTLVLTLAVLLAATGAFAAPKPPTNAAPTVNSFDVPDESASPIPVLAFTATDSDGTIAGYLITESSDKPNSSTPGWTATAPTSYTTTSVGTITLYAWAMDNGEAISNSKSDTVTIPDPLLQRLAALEAQVAALQDLLQHFSRNGNDVAITGANLHIRSGSGQTNGPVNGLGNLIVGYNELGNDGYDVRTGSHNIITGLYLSYSSYGGILTGHSNLSSGPFSSTIGGTGNIASGDNSLVLGGNANTASGPLAVVIGGSMNSGAGTASFAAGGNNNQAGGGNAVVVGGNSNSAEGICSSIHGGNVNATVGWASSVSGGQFNTASGVGASVSGGRMNTASSEDSSVGGGYSNTASGSQSFVAGGWGNQAVDAETSVIGGNENTAWGWWSTVLGGTKNTASGQISTITGGRENTTAIDAMNSVVSGGYQRSVSGWYNWAAGSLLELQ